MIMKKKQIFSVLASLIIATQLFSPFALAAKNTSDTADTSTKAETNETSKKETTTKTSSEKDTTKTSETSDEKVASFPKPRAKSAIVIDANSGDVIFAMESTKKLHPAGTSNIMTAIVALENAPLHKKFTVTADALKNITYDQPQLGLKEGESYTLEQLLYATLLNSNNDAANVIAIGVSGSIEKFVAKMNEKATSLGLKNTKFTNPTGMQNKSHYMSAEDLATLARYAMKNETFKSIVKTPKYEFPASLSRSESTMLSTNHLVSRYKYPYHFYANATGVKSGNSEGAGYCLVASAEKNGLSLISVVMGCDNQDAKDGAYSFIDTTKMFEYVFENYQSVLLTKKGDVVFDSKVSESKNSTRVALTVENDVYITLKKNIDTESITNEVNVVQDLKAPIKQGDYFGTISYFYNGKKIRTANIVAANEVKRDFILHIIYSILHFIFNPFVLIILIAIISISIRSRIVRARRRRIRRERLISQNGGNRPRTTSSTSSTSRTSSTSSTQSRSRTRSYDDYRKR